MEANGSLRGFGLKIGRRVAESECHLSLLAVAKKESVVLRRAPSLNAARAQVVQNFNERERFGRFCAYRPPSKRARSAREDRSPENYPRVPHPTLPRALPPASMCPFSARVPVCLP